MSAKTYPREFEEGTKDTGDDAELEYVDDDCESQSECSRLTDEDKSDDDMSVYSELPEEKENDPKPHDTASQAGSSNQDEWEEDEYPPLDLNYDAIKHVATYYLPGNHGRCTDITTHPRGSYHEIRILHFEDGWSCIGRFTRDRQAPLDSMESEYATVNHLRQYTEIPVPEIYFANFDPSHAVGAPFTLMERIPGAHLYKIWDDLTTEHKKAALKQIADVVVQLAGLEFSSIGSLRADGSIGDIAGATWHRPPPAGHSFATTEDYLLADMPDPVNCTEEMNDLNQRLKTDLLSVVEANRDHAALSAPYRLIHTDLDGQNMLFTQSDPSEPPMLSGIIDWDYSRTGLLYELLEYPIFIQDIHWSEHLYAENKILRKYFVRCLADKYPKGPREREDVKDCFRMKDWFLQNFDNMWAFEDTVEDLRKAAQKYDPVLGCLSTAYQGRLDWEPDSELESEDEADDETTD